MPSARVPFPLAADGVSIGLQKHAYYGMFACVLCAGPVSLGGSEQAREHLHPSCVMKDTELETRIFSWSRAGARAPSPFTKDGHGRIYP